ncbi:MAG: BatD family protein [Planctomycetota bacterium]
MRRAPRAALVAVLGLAALAAQDRAFVRVDAPDAVVQGQVFAVRVTVGVERAVLPKLVQLFRRELDVPVQVTAPWLDGTRALPRFAGAAAGSPAGSSAVSPVGPVLALAGDAAVATAVDDVARDGRTFAVWTVDRRLLAREPGAHELLAPQLRFAFATQFRDDFVNGRVALDRTDVSVPGAPVTVTVRPLPTEGRPAQFTGAVGEFTVEAEARPRELAVGEHLELTVRVRGDGDLRGFAPPQLALPGLHAFGVLDGGVDGDARVLRYDLVPTTSAVDAVPPVAFAFYAPGVGYREVRTAAIPLQVRPAAAGGDGNGAARPVEVTTRAPGLADIFASGELPRDGGRTGSAFAAAALLLPWAVALALLALRRPRAARGATTAAPRELAAAFARAAESRHVDLLSAFDAYVTARLGSPPAADALAARLHALGVPADLAQRAGRLRRSLEAARYGGVSAGAAVAADDVVRALEQHFEGGTS